MSELSGKDLKTRWIANAERLNKKGHFARYSSKQRNEVLKKGFLGPYPPDRAIKLAKEQAERGHGYRMGKFNDDMRGHFQLVGTEVRDRLLRIYFKFQIIGTATKPQVLFWSCHPPLF